MKPSNVPVFAPRKPGFLAGKQGPQFSKSMPQVNPPNSQGDAPIPNEHPRAEAKVPAPSTSPSAAVGAGSGSVRTILLMGETGSGKSTFINYLANYFGGGTLRALKVVIPNKAYPTVTEVGFAHHSEANMHDTTVSQTRRCTIYSFKRGADMYRFIDTPGLSDTSNSAVRCVDDENITTILSAAGQAGELQAIILIINGSTARLTINLKNALQRIAGNYPDVLLNNMLAIFTNTSDGTINFDKDSLVNKPKKSFTMNNAAFSSLSSIWDEDELGLQEIYWRQSMRKMNDIIAFIDQLAPQSTRVFRDMLSSRQEIKSQVFIATTEIAKQQIFIELLEKLRRQEVEIQAVISRDQAEADLRERDANYLKTREALNAQARVKTEGDEKGIQDQRRRAEAEAAKTASQLSTNRQQLEEAKRTELPKSYYLEYEQMTYKKIRNTDYHNTMCRVHKVTCHEGCGLDFTNVAGDDIFNYCECMNESRMCTNCGCGIGPHLHAMYLIEEVTENVEKTNEAKREEYAQKLREIRNLEFSIASLTEETDKAQDEIRRCDALLANVSKHSTGIHEDEKSVQLQREEALKKKRAAEASLKAAKDKKTSIQSQLLETENKLQAARQALRQAQIVVEAKCRELKAICSKFNFVEELKVTQDSLRTSMSTLTSSEARDRAEAFIKTLNQLADGLTG